jgi:hypothetical protein
VRLQANIALSADEMAIALAQAEGLERPAWLGNEEGQDIEPLQVTRMLLHLATRQPDIATLHKRYGVPHVDLPRWLSFIRAEQVASACLSHPAMLI